MSYCRWGDDSDVYVYEDVRGGYEINFAQGRSVSGDIHAETATECRDYLVSISNEVKVPPYAIDRLNKEILAEPQHTIVEAFQALREAGGHNWDGQEYVKI